MSQEAEITQSTENKITTIEFYHPKGNSMPGDHLRELAETIRKAGEDEATKVILLKSRGSGAFCAGASFDELVSISNFDEGKRFFMGFALVINAMRECPKLIVCRVQGKVVGGGVGIAAAADYTLATDTAAIKLSELALGIGPFVVGPAVERKVGTSAFGTLSLNPTEWQSADWAYQRGFYSELHASEETLDESVEQLTAKLAGYSSAAMKQMKTVLWESTEHWSDLLEKRAEISGELVLSEEAQQAIETARK